jgi:CheY-like chemotaxis protein
LVVVAVIIEDQPLHGKLFAAMLRGFDISAVVALSGSEGLALAAATVPDVVIVDLILPDVRGQDVIARLRQASGTMRLPIIAITAAPERELEDECLAAGANVFLGKPVRMEQLRKAVKLALGSSLSQ